MTEYQPTEQDKVLLDYAQTAQRRADPWVEFEYQSMDGKWRECTHSRSPASSDGCTQFRRKPRTVTLKYGEKEWELPVPIKATELGNRYGVFVATGTQSAESPWLAALREIAGGQNA